MIANGGWLCRKWLYGDEPASGADGLRQRFGQRQGFPRLKLDFKGETGQPAFHRCTSRHTSISVPAGKLHRERVQRQKNTCTGVRLWAPAIIPKAIIASLSGTSLLPARLFDLCDRLSQRSQLGLQRLNLLIFLVLQLVVLRFQLFEQQPT